MAKIFEQGRVVNSIEREPCADCGRVLPVSDWPGNDPDNQEAVVCVSKHHGDLVCDECERKRDEEVKLFFRDVSE